MTSSSSTRGRNQRHQHGRRAGYAGVRAAVGTSGGGFALMNEAFSLAGMSETPVVIFEVQRPGPRHGDADVDRAG